MAIITLTTDLGNKDYYVPAIKGLILRHSPDAKLVDITNDIPSFDIFKAAFIIKNSYFHFPEGTIHLIGVDPDQGGLNAHLIIKENGHYFIGSDNGIFSLLFDKTPEKVYELSFTAEPDDLRFPNRYYARAAAHLANGGTPELIAKPGSIQNQKDPIKVKVQEDSMVGTIIYIDKFGNLVSNISESYFNQIRRSRNFKVFFRGNEEGLKRISANVSVAKTGDIACVFGASGNLEIAINKGSEDHGGSAASLLGLKLMDTVRIEFYNE
jgi:S-adenosylmethionine hydrolase